MGLRIVRFENEEIMKNLSAVMGKIRRRIYAMNHLDHRKISVSYFLAIKHMSLLALFR